MKTMFRLAAVALVAAVAASSARAQVQAQPPQKIEIQPPQKIEIQPGGPFGKGFLLPPEIALLQDKGVQKELKLTDEQIKKADAIKADPKDPKSMLDPEAIKKAVADILDRDQTKRLGQLVIQARGVQVFLTDPKIREELKFTDDQTKKIAMAFSDAMSKLMTPPDPKKIDPKDLKDFKDIEKKFAEAGKAAMAEAVKVLTPEQQTKWKEMVGAPYEGTLPFVSPFGRPPVPPGGLQLPPRGQQFPPEFWDSRFAAKL